MLFVDGAYAFDDAAPRLHRVAAPTQAELQRLLHAIATRTTRALECQGLLIRDDLTRESFLPDGFFRTGDQARMDEDGYIKITGRIKDLIIRGGVNIAPVEIKSVLFAHPKVANAAVVGMPDPRLGERICAWVILDADAAGDAILTVAEVQVWMQEAGLAKPKWPERTEVVDTFPMTASGKVQKFRLREWIAARLETETGRSE